MFNKNGGSQAPIHRLKKGEIMWLANHKCRHSHSYLEHYQCYLNEKPEVKEKIGHLDIETSNLDANFGIMLSYCIKEDGTDKIYSGVIEKKHLNKKEFWDAELVRKCVKDIQRFDKITTFYGRKFDIPFIRTRALVCDVDFPVFGTIKHTDVYYWAKFKLKLNSNRLENVCRVILKKTNKTHLEHKYWLRALQGDNESLAYILEHNKYDVIDLEKVYHKLIDFASLSNPSI